MLVLDDYWVWDSWYLHDGARWHCWYLKAPKSIGDPDLRHWNVSQGHAISDDLVEWRDHSTALAPSLRGWDDYTTWTGSTLRGDDGRWHYFYTGTSHAENGLVQRIGHAVGDDLESWKRVGDGLCLDLKGTNADLYEIDHLGRWHDRAFRDPWVMKDPSGDGWLMYFTARAGNLTAPNDAGCIGLATSPDLMDWTLQPAWGQLEVPQVFEVGGKWYCLFCMDPAHQSKALIEERGSLGRGNHYLMADDPRGPWHLPDGPALDVTAERYAGRIVDHGGLFIMGFKDGEARGEFGGYLMNPEPVYRRADGTLSLSA